MNTLIVFLVSMVFLLVVLIRFKWSASVGLVSATIMMGLLSGMKIAELTGAISGGFGSTMTSTGLVIIFGCIFGEMLGSSGALEEIAKFLLAQGRLQARLPRDQPAGLRGLDPRLFRVGLRHALAPAQFAAEAHQ